jgi:hypothetical protein
MRIEPELKAEHMPGYKCKNLYCWICRHPWMPISWRYYLELIVRGYWKRIRIKILLGGKNV